jgi:hypothetical protein
VKIHQRILFRWWWRLFLPAGIRVARALRRVVRRHSASLSVGPLLPSLLPLHRRSCTVHECTHSSCCLRHFKISGSCPGVGPVATPVKILAQSARMPAGESGCVDFALRYANWAIRNSTFTMFQNPNASFLSFFSPSSLSSASSWFHSPPFTHDDSRRL